MKFIFTHSTIGRTVAYLKKVSLDLVKKRRESGSAEKV